MRPDDFFAEAEMIWVEGMDPWNMPVTRAFNASWVAQLRRGPAPAHDDLDVIAGLARLAHDQLERYGTDGGQELSEDDIRTALLALQATVGRLGITGFALPFRDYGTFRSYWLRRDCSGSWQCRRDLLIELFDPLHDQILDLEVKAYAAETADPVSPRPLTGWTEVDTEIMELRRHFKLARSAQDHRNIGNDCIAVLEALSRQVYDPAVHLRPGETEPPVANTKQRIGRFIEDAATGSDNTSLRGLARGAIEFAQRVKHTPDGRRRDAGISADAVILLANILRRLDEPGEEPPTTPASPESNV